MTHALKLAAVVTFFVAGAAAAEPFTSTSKSQPITNARAPAVGGFLALGAGANQGELTATFRSGRVEHASFHCIGWSIQGQPQTAVCEAESGADRYSMRVTCLTPDPATRTGFCQGVLIGTAGRYAGKIGLFSQLNRPDGTATAEGVWND
ncbi:hypothetical protein [Phenylobacterium sp.]|uniref:hypothetical protein n=1 Tax=Phenylobacterium sp. TaxID=1871053 RepID=UPI00286C4F15|nr:hypothetical protein [Phenylobacterium sp.]